MYVIKQEPEEFVVDEVLPLNTTEQGSYSYWLLKKTNVNTLDAIERLSKKLRIPLKYLAFSGNKDKRAITSQTISVYKAQKQRIEKLSLHNIKLTFLGYGEQPIHLGQHTENTFQITVRNAQTKPEMKGQIPNYFGEQRFSEKNVEIGRAIVRKEFKKAVLLLKSDLPREESKDYIGALRKLPRSLLKLYLHSYQSYLWNQTAKKYLAANPKTKNLRIPIIGFGTELGTDKLSAIIKQLLEEEKVNLRDFIIRQIPGLSSEGDNRDLFMQVKEYGIKSFTDELNPGKKKYVLSFALPKGSYATVLVDALFAPQSS